MNSIELWKKERIFKLENNNLKRKKFIYVPFTKAIDLGFIDGEIRNYLYACSLAHYYRQNNYNVLFVPSFNDVSFESYILSKVLNNRYDASISKRYYDDLIKLGISFDYDKQFRLGNLDNIRLIQEMFNDLWDKNYISYTKREVAYDHVSDKIYDMIQYKPNLVKEQRRALFFNISSFSNLIAENIKRLAISNNLKDTLLCFLEPKDVYYLSLYISNDELINVEIENLELLGGVNTLLINYNLKNIIDYVSPSKIHLLEEFLKNRSSLFLDTDLYFVNPLTGKKGNVYLAKNLSEDYKLVNQGDIKDNSFIEALGLTKIELLENDKLINSDFLNGLTRSEALEIMTKNFIDEGLVSLNTIYRKKDILVSDLGEYGIRIPLVTDGNNYLALKDNLPVYYNEQYRLLISNPENIKDGYSLVDGIINELFIMGLEIILIISSLNNLALSSKELITELKKWYNCAVMVVKGENFVYNIFMQLVFVSFFEHLSNTKIISHNECIILEKFYDLYGSKISKEDNNCLDLADLIDNYTADSIRLYILSVKADSNVYFSKEKLFTYKLFLDDIRQYYNKGFSIKNDDLDLDFIRFKSFLTELLDHNNLSKYIETIEEFFNKVMKKNFITREHALDYLIALSIVAPILAEELHTKLYNERGLIIDEGWFN